MNRVALRVLTWCASFQTRISWENPSSVLRAPSSDIMNIFDHLKTVALHPCIIQFQQLPFTHVFYVQFQNYPSLLCFMYSFSNYGSLRYFMHTGVLAITLFFTPVFYIQFQQKHFMPNTECFLKFPKQVYSLTIPWFWYLVSYIPQNKDDL